MSQQTNRVTIRIPEGKEQVYATFKEVVKDLGSDICYVNISLMEAFNTAIKNAPNAASPVTMKFLRQSIQLNIGCNFNYTVKKSRRLPEQDLPKINLDKNYTLPLLLEEWPTLKPEVKAFWRQRLEEGGIIPQSPKRKRRTGPSVSTGKRKKHKHNFFRSMKQSMTFVTGKIKGFFRNGV